MGKAASKRSSVKPRRFLLHPLFFAVYPILALLAYNVDQSPVSQALRPIVVSVMGAVLAFLLISRVAKSVEIGAFLTTVLLILFFSYGHIHSFIEFPISLFGINLRNHRYLLPIFTCIFLFAVWAIRKKPKAAKDINNLLNLVGALLLLFPLFQISNHYYQLYTRAAQIQSTSVAAEENDGNLKPDVYLIILDMYTRGDFMSDRMGFDNSPFLDSLRSKGFYVAECSLSNYSTTKLSMASALNINYLDVLFPMIAPDDTDESILDEPLKNSYVRRFFEELGYSIVAFQNDYFFTEWTDADYYFEMADYAGDSGRPSTFPSNDNLTIFSTDNLLSQLLFRLNLNSFEWLLMQTTAAQIIPDYVARTTSPQEVDSLYFDSARKYFLFNQTLERATDAVQIEGPKFFYLHLIEPHPQFTFAADGSFESMGEEYSEAEWYQQYAEQVQYLNTRVLAFIDVILANAETEPIIVVQGDHGVPWFEEGRESYQHNEILNAYLLPKGADQLYSSISPVNSWRLILDQNFNMNLELLPDIAYTYDWRHSVFRHEVYSEQSERCK